MTANSSASRFPIDALLQFRVPGLAAVSTATIAVGGAAGSPVSLDMLTPYWAGNTVANLEEFAVIFTTESNTAASWQFAVLVDTDPAFSSPTPVTLATSPGFAGRTVIGVTREMLGNALAALVVAGENSVGQFTATPVWLTVSATPVGGGVAWNAYASPLAGR